MTGTIVLSENACFVDHFCFIENEGIVFLFRNATVIGVATKDPVDLSHAESWDSIYRIYPNSIGMEHLLERIHLATTR